MTMTDTIEIRGGTLIDGTGGPPLADATVQVAGGVIQAVRRGPDRPAAGAVEVLDARGKTVLPGLIDAHCHLSYGEGRSAEEVDVYGGAEWSAVRAVHNAGKVLRAGVTGVCDPGSTWNVAVTVRDAVAHGMVAGQRELAHPCLVPRTRGHRPRPRFGRAALPDAHAHRQHRRVGRGSRHLALVHRGEEAGAGRPRRHLSAGVRRRHPADGRLRGGLLGDALRRVARARAGAAGQAGGDASDGRHPRRHQGQRRDPRLERHRDGGAGAAGGSARRGRRPAERPRRPRRPRAALRRVQGRAPSRSRRRGAAPAADAPRAGLRRVGAAAPPRRSDRRAVRMPFVNANGLRLFYQDTGSGPPLLLLMGPGLDHGFWAKQIPVYGEHFRCLALDNRGIGRSQVPPAGYSVEDMATDTLQVMDALGLEAAHVSGFSMGGSIALAMALRAPARVLTLSLHSTCGRQYPFIKHRYRVLVAVTRAGDPDLWAEATVITAFSDR